LTRALAIVMQQRQDSYEPRGAQRVLASVAAAVSFSLELGFFCFIWGSGVFIENLVFFDSGQILEMYVGLLYFPFDLRILGQHSSFFHRRNMCRVISSQYMSSRARLNQIVWSALTCQGLLVHDFGMLFCFEDAVVENLFIVLRAHIDCVSDEC